MASSPSVWAPVSPLAWLYEGESAIGRVHLGIVCLARCTGETPPRIAAAAQALPPQVVAAAQARGRARDLEATADALLEELCARVETEGGQDA